MGIDKTNPLSHQCIAFDKEQHLFLRVYRCLGQIVEYPEHTSPLAQMLNPDRGIYQDHAGLDCQRGISVAVVARCRPAAPAGVRSRVRSMSSAPSRTRAVVLVTPVMRRASSSNRSSIFRVVRVAAALFPAHKKCAAHLLDSGTSGLAIGQVSSANTNKPTVQ